MARKERYDFKYIDENGEEKFDRVDAYGEDEAWDLLKVFEPEIYDNPTVEMVG